MKFSADMTNKKLIPYVELFARPHRGPLLPRSSPEPSPEAFGSSNPSPRKRRKIQKGPSDVEESLTDIVLCIPIFRLLSVHRDKGQPASNNGLKVWRRCMYFHPAGWTSGNKPPKSGIVNELEF